LQNRLNLLRTQLGNKKASISTAKGKVDGFQYLVYQKMLEINSNTSALTWEKRDKN